MSIEPQRIEMVTLSVEDSLALLGFVRDVQDSIITATMKPVDKRIQSYRLRRMRDLARCLVSALEDLEMGSGGGD